MPILSSRKTTLPEDKEPFLVPKRVTATLETDKGTIVITSIYEAKPQAEMNKKALLQ
jgi:hypothetical protein